MTREPADGTAMRRAEVLRHVVALIGERGMDRMTMRQVAQATGLSTGTLNYHFGNKRGLTLAALESTGGVPLDAPSSEGVPEPRDAIEALHRIFAGFVLDSRERRDWWRFWVECTAQAARDEELRAFQRSRYEAQLREVERWIDAGARRGELRTDLDAGRLAEPLLALAYGLAMAQLTAPDTANARRAADALEGSIRELGAR